MEQWSVEHDRPYVRPQPSPYPWIVALLALALAAAAAGYYYYFQPKEQAPSGPVTQPAPQEAPPAAPQAKAPESVKLPAPEATARPLPTLDNSDSMMRETIAGLLGRKAFDDFVVPDQLVRRIVATVDNLPRQTAPRRMLPLNGVPGPFGITSAAAGSEEWTIHASNAARYSPFVGVFEAVHVRPLVWSYVQAYPLFQRAYEELGFPGLYFNDRLIEAIDNLLAAPEATGSEKLIRNKVLYEFVDPGLEARSAGQKIMIRMGADNSRRVKGKLREIREAIVAASRNPNPPAR